MMSDLEDKVVVITGGATGIGGAVSRAFGRRGARVLLGYLSGAVEAQAVVQGIEANYGHAACMPGDVTQPGALEALFDRAMEIYGRVDVLINNAGSMVERRALADIDDGFIDAVFDLNARSVVHACRLIVPIYRAQGWGNIINVSSISARSGGSAGSSLYSASKGFVSSFTRSLAKELAPDNIRVNAVSPGTIATRFHETFSTPEKLEQTKKTIPQGKLGTPDDCAGAFLYLASDNLSTYVTGQVLEVNGGQLMP